jgi:hypothetical protein
MGGGGGGGRGKHCFSLNQFYSNKKHPEAEFLNVIETKAWKDFLLAIHSHFYERILLPPPALSKSGLYCNIVYGNHRSGNSQDYAQKPQRNCMFMNSASENLYIQ